MIQGIAKKRPVDIHFFKWDNCRLNKLFEWIRGFGEKPESHIQAHTYQAPGSGELLHKISVNILEGGSYEVPSGYIIIRGVQGEYYPCEPNIFNKTYEIIENEEKQQ